MEEEEASEIKLRGPFWRSALCRPSLESAGEMKIKSTSIQSKSCIPQTPTPPSPLPHACSSLTVFRKCFSRSLSRAKGYEDLGNRCSYHALTCRHYKKYCISLLSNKHTNLGQKSISRLTTGLNKPILLCFSQTVAWRNILRCFLERCILVVFMYAQPKTVCQNLAFTNIFLSTCHDFNKNYGCAFFCLHWMT